MLPLLPLLLCAVGMGLELSEHEDEVVVRPSSDDSVSSVSPHDSVSWWLSISISMSTLRQMESVSLSSTSLVVKDAVCALAACLAAFAAAAFSFFFDIFFTRGAFTFLVEGGARSRRCKVEFHRFLIALSVLPGKFLAISAHLLPCTSCS